MATTQVRYTQVRVQRCGELTLSVNNGGLSRKHLIEGINASLKRLQLDYGKCLSSGSLHPRLTAPVDLIYAHRPDRNTPIEETVRAFNHIINTGKAFYWGTSEWNPEEIAMAWGIANRLNMIGPIMFVDTSVCRLSTVLSAECA